MTLADLLPQLPLSYAEGKAYGLVFADEIKVILDQIRQEMQQEQGKPAVHQTAPVATTDSRWVLCGDLLSEVGPDGIFQSGFMRLDPVHFDDVLVIPWSEALALLPPPEIEI